MANAQSARARLAVSHWSLAMSERGRMVRCTGCGFNVEREDAREYVEYSSDLAITCKLCEHEPRLKESYRRGFNAGLDALKAAVDKVDLRKRDPR